MTAGETATRQPSGYFFLTPVWGESYTRLYVDVVIPAQLAPGNLPALQHDSSCRYIIYTRPEDADVIRSSSVFERLNACVPVTFEWISPNVSVIHDLMTDCFRRGIAEAEAAGAAFLLMTPDIVYSAGSFATIKRLSRQGNDVVFIPAIRTIKNAVAQTLTGNFRSDDAIVVPPRQLVRVALDNLHPLGHSSWWEEGGGGLIPANIYWRVGNEGLIAHCFHLHPVMVFPQQKGVRFFGTVDDDYIIAACPDFHRDCIVTDSDDLFAIELSDPSRYFEMRFRKRSVTDTVRWAEQFTNQRHQNLFTKTIQMHTGVEHPEAWRAAEARARSVVEEISARLHWPITRLIFDADLIPRRLVRSIKEARLRIANPHLSGRSGGGDAFWRRAVLTLFGASMGVRGALVRMMQRLAVWIEGLAARPYRRVLDRQLSSLIEPSAGVVLVSNSPGKIHAASWLASRSGAFARDRYVAIATEDTVAFFDGGMRLGDGTKSVVLLEIDAHRSGSVANYLQEASRVLHDGGQLVVHLHRLTAFADQSGLTKQQLAKSLSLLFEVTESLDQGGLGTLLRVKLENGVRGMINRRLDLRGLILLLCLPLLPLIVLSGAVVIAITALLDSFGGASRFGVSSLLVGRKRSGSGAAP